MAKEYKGRYGLSGLDVKNLSARLYKLYRHDWGSTDEFILWASRTGYHKGMTLVKEDEMKPHGPDNSYWYSRTDIKNDIKRRKEFRRDNVSAFCQDCDKKCPALGCKEYQEWWAKNWNTNLHQKKEEPQEPQEGVTRVWQYEHPDLVREGIVFEGSGSM